MSTPTAGPSNRIAGPGIAEDVLDPSFLSPNEPFVDFGQLSYASASGNVDAPPDDGDGDLDDDDGRSVQLEGTENFTDTGNSIAQYGADFVVPQLIGSHDSGYESIPKCETEKFANDPADIVPSSSEIPASEGRETSAELYAHDLQNIDFHQGIYQSGSWVE